MNLTYSSQTTELAGAEDKHRHAGGDDLARAAYWDLGSWNFRSYKTKPITTQTGQNKPRISQVFPIPHQYVVTQSISSRFSLGPTSSPCSPDCDPHNPSHRHTPARSVSQPSDIAQVTSSLYYTSATIVSVPCASNPTNGSAVW